MDSYFFNGFADEMVKLSASNRFPSGDLRISSTGEMAQALGEMTKTERGKIGALSAALGVPTGSLIGLLMGGKGRRLKGMGVGALGGAALAGAQGAMSSERFNRYGRNLLAASEKKASERAVSDLGFKRIKEQAGLGALSTGGLAALIAAIASKKGHKLKRALAGGAAGGAVGGLSSGHVAAKQMEFLQDMYR